MRGVRVSRSLMLLFVLAGLTTGAYSSPADSALFFNRSAGLKPPAGSFRVYHAKSGVDYAYIQPPNARYLNFVVSDYRDYFATTFRVDNIPYIGAMAIATGFLVDIDQDITDQAQHLGDRLGLKHTNKQKALFKWSLKLGGKSVQTPLNFPQDLESGMYFLGDGIVHSSVAVGLWGYGKAAGDDRAVQTGTQCMEAIICTGVGVQILKHSFGRESPQVATEPGGKWRPLPNPADYQRHVPNYDAMPSGHIATAMATVTVIADNYPDKRWIRPLGYSLMGVLMYAMLNNGVHWASDYPLGISLGYAFAKICDQRSRTIIAKSAAESSSGPTSLLRHTAVVPYWENRSAGLSVIYQF